MTQSGVTNSQTSADLCLRSLTHGGSQVGQPNHRMRQNPHRKPLDGGDKANYNVPRAWVRDHLR
jgi:hypothetical protein